MRLQGFHRSHNQVEEETHMMLVAIVRDRALSRRKGKSIGG